MDLSNLSTNLPPSRPVTESQLHDLDTKVTQEFKSAANSVAALYRLSNQKNMMLQHKGYLNCLDDLLNIIKLHKIKGNSADRLDGIDLENWALTRKAELMGGENINRGLIFDDAVQKHNNSQAHEACDDSADSDESEENRKEEYAQTQEQTNNNNLENYEFKFNMPRKLTPVPVARSYKKIGPEEDDEFSVEETQGLKRACVQPFIECKRQSKQ